MQYDGVDRAVMVAGHRFRDTTNNALNGSTASGVFKWSTNPPCPVNATVTLAETCCMDAKSRFSIQHLLLYTFAVAFLVAAPAHAHRLVLSDVWAGMVWLAYNGLAVAMIVYPLWILAGRRLVVPVITTLLFALNFGPEIVTIVDLVITGDNDATGCWLAERGLDYDPWLSVPCWCSIAGSG